MENLSEIISQIPMYKVTSSNLEAIGYNPDKQVMRVIFKGGSSYLYYQVEPETWNMIINSESKGKTLNESVIKQKEKYKFIRTN